jgi:hypothetical protein
MLEDATILLRRVKQILRVEKFLKPRKKRPTRRSATKGAQITEAYKVH